MKRWNEYYESMAPKKRESAPSSAVSNVRTEGRHFSLFPPKVTVTHTPQTSARSPQPNRQHIPLASTAETIFNTAQYSHQRNDTGHQNDSNTGSKSNRVDGGHVNFAWVD